MTTRRQEQVATFLREEISEIIQRELKDPRLGFVSITRVEVSPDLRYARAFVSVFGSEEEREATMQALTSAAGFIRHLLKPRMHIRHVPEVSFRADRSMEYAEQVARALHEVHDQIHPQEEQPIGSGESRREDRDEGVHGEQ